MQSCLPFLTNEVETTPKGMRLRPALKYVTTNGENPSSEHKKRRLEISLYETNERRRKPFTLYGYYFQWRSEWVKSEAIEVSVVRGLRKFEMDGENDSRNYGLTQPTNKFKTKRYIIRSSSDPPVMHARNSFFLNWVSTRFLRVIQVTWGIMHNTLGSTTKKILGRTKQVIFQLLCIQELGLYRYELLS